MRKVVVLLACVLLAGLTVNMASPSSAIEGFSTEPQQPIVVAFQSRRQDTVPPDPESTPTREPQTVTVTVHSKVVSIPPLEVLAALEQRPPRERGLQSHIQGLGIAQGYMETLLGADFVIDHLRPLGIEERHSAPSLWFVKYEYVSGDCTVELDVAIDHTAAPVASSRVVEEVSRMIAFPQKVKISAKEAEYIAKKGGVNAAYDTDLRFDWRSRRLGWAVQNLSITNLGEVQGYLIDAETGGILETLISDGPPPPIPEPSRAGQPSRFTPLTEIESESVIAGEEVWSSEFYIVSATFEYDRRTRSQNQVFEFWSYNASGSTARLLHKLIVDLPCGIVDDVYESDHIDVPPENYLHSTWVIGNGIAGIGIFQAVAELWQDKGIWPDERYDRVRVTKDSKETWYWIFDKPFGVSSNYYCDDSWHHPSNKTILEAALTQAACNTGVYDAANTLKSWVYSYVTYNVNWGARSTDISVYNDRCGDCNDFADLYIGLARSINIPTRIVIGYTYEEYESCSSEGFLDTMCDVFCKKALVYWGHAWAESYYASSTHGTTFHQVDPTWNVIEEARCYINSDPCISHIQASAYTNCSDNYMEDCSWIADELTCSNGFVNVATLTDGGYDSSYYCPSDKDSDGTCDNFDSDKDGDGIPNGSDPEPCRPSTPTDLKQCSDLSISPSSLQVDETVTFSFDVCNDGGQSVTFQNIGPQGHGPPNGQGGLWNVFAHDINVGGGQTVNVSASRSFEWEGTWCIEHVPTQDQHGNWHDLSANGYKQAQCFEVSSSPSLADLRQAADLQVSPAYPMVDQEVTFSYAVKNYGGESITIDTIIPQGHAYDDGQQTGLWNVPSHNITVGPGETVNINAHRSFEWEATWCIEHIPVLDQNGGWFDLPANGYVQAQCFNVGPVSAPGGATLYEHEDYEGQSETFTSDDGNLGDNAIRHDRATSVRVRGPYFTTLYEHPDYAGTAESFHYDDSNLSDNHIGSDTVSSLRVYPAVALCEHSNFEGKCETFVSDNSRLNDSYIGHDTVTSIQVPSCYEVTLYEHPSYEGRLELFTDDDSNLTNNHIGNDVVSSIKVERIVLDGITLFEHENFVGRNRTFSSDEPNLPGEFVDMATSIKIRGPFMATVYEHPDYEGTGETFNYDDPDLPNNHIGNDTISSLRVWPAVALYEHTSYRGKCETFDSDVGNLSGTYIEPDTASSLKVPIGYFVTLCEHPNFEGTCQTFTGDVSDLRYTDVGDNAVSSIIVSSPTSDTTPPTGYFWRPQSGDATNMDSVTIEAQAYDSESGVAAVEFWVWVDEGHWEFIDTDIEGWDGWQAIWDVSQISDQTVWFFLRIRDNAGNEAWNPDNSVVWFVIDRVDPTGEITSPAPDFYIHSDQVDIVATANDDRSGVIGLQFFVWYDDGSGYGWHGLPLDWDGSDGWTSVWYTSDVADQEWIGFWIYIFDKAGNMGHYSHEGITLDRVPPCVLFGDFTCDCDVDVQDIQQVASRWRMVETDPNWDALYDLDSDGIITVVDIMKVSAHWGDTCELLAATLRPSGMEIERPTQPPAPKSIP
jgi:transglutaminase-like putative cysteine protease